MIVISDTNILSSFACANVLSALLQLFQKATIVIPFSVYTEIEQGQQQGRSYLNDVINLIQDQKIQLFTLSQKHQDIARLLPATFHAGERECMALASIESVPYTMQ